MVYRSAGRAAGGVVVDAMEAHRAALTGRLAGPPTEPKECLKTNGSHSTEASSHHQARETAGLGGGGSGPHRTRRYSLVRRVRRGVRPARSEARRCRDFRASVGGQAAELLLGAVGPGGRGPG